jgi:hypothetical protein
MTDIYNATINTLLADPDPVNAGRWLMLFARSKLEIELALIEDQLCNERNTTKLAELAITKASKRTALDTLQTA